MEAAMRAHYVEDAEGFLRYLEIPGDDPPILWLHGLLCASTAELAPVPVQEPLAGRRSLIVDFFGYGFSDRPEQFGYSLADHARTILSLLDGLELERCYLVGHSMGGAVATLVASQRPDVVAALVPAEGSLEPDEEPDGLGQMIAGQSEEQFAATGLAELINSHEQLALQDHAGVPAAHLGMLRVLSARAVHRSAGSLVRGTDPTVRSLLKGLHMPRFYLYGELTEFTDQEREANEDLQASGVEYLAVPKAGHPMGLQNPHGFAERVAQAIA
jgi:pimeloyl-ACP methyl ester carboxylesterase